MSNITKLVLANFSHHSNSNGWSAVPCLITRSIKSDQNSQDALKQLEIDSSSLESSYTKESAINDFDNYDNPLDVVLIQASDQEVIVSTLCPSLSTSKFHVISEAVIDFFNTLSELDPDEPVKRPHKEEQLELPIFS